MTMKPEESYIKGTPEECGAQLFERFVLPALASTKGYPPAKSPIFTLDW